ncbi:MAG TPA: hypothetical protein VF691_11110 [Cytophagaceae bacterium]|jgi:hypothetical protein
MYKIQDLIRIINLKDIEIPNQDKIIAQTGSKLDLEEAYKVIEVASENFSQYDEKAIEADNLLSQLIDKYLRKKAIEDAVELPVKMNDEIEVHPFDNEIVIQPEVDEDIVDVQVEKQDAPPLEEEVVVQPIVDSDSVNVQGEKPDAPPLKQNASVSRKRKLRLLKIKLSLKK